MKTSRYNSYIRLGNGKILGYNAFNRRFALITPEVHHRLTSAEATGNMPEIADDVTSARLKEAGFIIPTSMDEASVLDKEIFDLDFDTKAAEVHINPTLNCNFRCWYCYEEHQPKSELSPEVFNALKNYLSSVIRSGIKAFNLGFFGGEPLLKFSKICRPLIEWTAGVCKAHGVDFRTSFTTNSYLLTQATVDFLKQYDCGLQITLDGHRELHDQVRFPRAGMGSYDRILRNIVMAADAGINVVMRINYTLGNLESVGNIVSDLAVLGISSPEKIHANFQRVWQDMDNGGNETVKSLIAKHGRRLEEIGLSYSTPDLNNSRFSSCYGDKANYICINYNGDFFKCTARDFKPERRAGHLAPDGTLVWEPGRKEAWEHARFSLQACRGCRIAPICLGGCRQRGVESQDDGNCPLGYDDTRKDELILQRFEHQYLQS